MLLPPNKQTTPTNQPLTSHNLTAESYTASLLAAERDADVMRAMEVVTEARVLKLALPREALEAGIRTFAASGQWQRAVDMLEALASDGSGPAAPETAEAVFVSLSNAGGEAAGARALALFEAMEAAGGVAAPIRNILIRTCASGGQLERAIELLEAAVMARSSMELDDGDEQGGGGSASAASDRFYIEGMTYSVVATECIKAGLQGKAEEVLDLRDYL